MTICVQKTHPTRLQEPKIIRKLVNGTEPHEPDVGLTNGDTATTVPQSGFSQKEDRDGEDARAVLALRNLVFDICNHNGGGHGGSALGMAAIGVALYKYVMRYNPSNPSWFDRDRFVLSNGKLCPRPRG